MKALPAARCPAGGPRKAGRLQLSAPAYVTDESTGVPMFVLVTRTGGTKGKASVTVTTQRGLGRRRAATTRRRARRSRFAGGDASPRLVEIPILEDQAPEAAQTFTVSLSHPRCAKLGAQRAAR